MKKEFMAVLFFSLVMILLTGCSGHQDWDSGEVTINGTTITLPFSYSEINKISCGTADQYYNNISDQYVFNAGEDEPELVVVDAVNKGFVNLGCANRQAKACTLPHVTVYSVEAEMKNESTKLDIQLPGGISWGATVEEIEEVYGETGDSGEKKYDSSSLMTKLVYRSEGEGGEYTLTLNIQDDKGLQKLCYHVPCRDREGKDETAAIEERIETDIPVSADLAKLPGEWRQPAVRFEDKIFGFPMTVADLQSLGFSFKKEGKRSIFNPENTETCEMISEQYGEITVDLVNLDKNLRRPDCVWVDELELDAAKLKAISQISVTGDICFGDTPEQIERVFRGGPEVVVSDYHEGDSTDGMNYEYSLAAVATEQSSYCFGVDVVKGVQKIVIKKHRTVFPQKGEVR